jgi:hypothetical protein
MIPHGGSFPDNDCASEIPFVDVSFLNAFLVRPSVSSLTTYLCDCFLEVLVHFIVCCSEHSASSNAGRACAWLLC